MKNLLNIGVTLSINQLKKINGGNFSCQSDEECYRKDRVKRLQQPVWVCRENYCYGG